MKYELMTKADLQQFRDQAQLTANRMQQLRNAAFILETVAHLGGMEAELLPLADRLRFFIQHRRMPVSGEDLQRWLEAVDRA